jgi:protein MAK16
MATPHDELIWQLIGHGHCSFKSQVGRERAFCRNEYNVNGLCCRSSCPLASSRYATVREQNGRVFLFMKTIERAHSPRNLWERVALPKDYGAALASIDEQLAHWPPFLVHKNKQRLTKIVQYLIRMRKLTRVVQPLLVPHSRKDERRDRKNEDKALKAAKLESAIEKELLARLKQASTKRARGRARGSAGARERERAGGRPAAACARLRVRVRGGILWGRKRARAHAH